MIQFMQPTGTVKNMQRLIDGDLKHIGEALLAGRTVLYGGEPLVKGRYCFDASEYSILANDPSVLMPLLSDEVTLKCFKRLIDGDLAHIGAEIIAGKEMIQTATAVHRVNELRFDQKVGFYS
ncbi:MAG: hypothetical protein GY776_15480 [Alteromonas sp.]|nr:hypothetical protein [Alteromonas sp.]